MDKNLDIHIDEALKTYLTSGNEDASPAHRQPQSPSFTVSIKYAEGRLDFITAVIITTVTKLLNFS